MANRRDFEVVGETLVKVRCGEHLSGQWAVSGTPAVDSDGFPVSYHLVGELGLSANPIKVSLIGYHEDMRIDAFGSKAPADIIFNYAEAKIDMTLIHYNPSLLELCYNESMGGYVTGNGMTPPGTPLGGGKALYASGCHFLGLTLWPATQARFEADYNLAGGLALDAYLAYLVSLGYPPSTTADEFARSLIGSGAWNFYASHIKMEPQAIPLGTKVTSIDVSWRAIAYAHYGSRLGPGPIPSPNATSPPIPLYSRHIPDQILDKANEVFVP